ncbi:hypothetical protein GBO31_23090, partial [Aquimarina litoralis]|nr:hypothetical protein [Aquimarina litoralis]
MEEHSSKLKSIWGQWWEPFRKWLYPLWLLYETTIRFYEYALYTYYSIIDVPIEINEIAIQTLAICA